MSLSWLDHLGSIASILGLLIGLPAVLAALWQAPKSRQEARQVREGTMHTRDCLEFIRRDGTTIDIVPLETLNWLPREGDVILLPGDGVETGGELIPAAYLVESIRAFLRSSDPKATARSRGKAHQSSLCCNDAESLFHRFETYSEGSWHRVRSAFFLLISCLWTRRATKESKREARHRVRVG